MSKLIKEYIVCVGDSQLSLETKVNVMLGDGREPQGGITVQPGEKTIWWLQAMTRKYIEQ